MTERVRRAGRISAESRLVMVSWRLYGQVRARCWRWGNLGSGLAGVPRVNGTPGPSNRRDLIPSRLKERRSVFRKRGSARYVSPIRLRVETLTLEGGEVPQGQGEGRKVKLLEIMRFVVP